jgi:KaiC/GvpD/RAD55 family RecA-like ATPase
LPREQPIRRALRRNGRPSPRAGGRGFSALDGLAAFLEQEGNTLLIKGHAGAGKTTLALQLLAQLSPKGAGVYVSSRVSQGKVQRELPWAEFARNRGSRRRFEDLRLGSPEHFLEHILGAMAEGRSGHPVIVLDTWDGIAKEMSPQERLKAEKMIIAAADSSNARTIFVSEEPGGTTMDYLVDGVVEMKREEWHGRVFREIEIQKLRGTLIEQHRYLYTLEGGRFTLIPPYHDSAPAASPPPRRPEAIPEHEDSISFGSPRMDEVFGGLQKANAFTFTYDESIPYSAVRLITIPAVVNALNTGRGVFYVPLPGATGQEVAEAVRPHVGPAEFRECLALGSVGSDGGAGPPLYPISARQPKEASARVDELVSMVRARCETKSVLIVESLGMFEALFATRVESMVEAIAERASAVHSSRTDVVMFNIRSESPICSQTLALSGRYVRLFARDRSVVVLGEKPGTPAYALDHDRGNPLLAQLTLIV